MRPYPTLALRAMFVSSLILVSSAQAQQAQIGFGVNSVGTLFRFDVNAPSAVTTIGPLGFVPKGIDFRPGTNSLYAIDIGPNTTQLYTIDINTGSPTAVGAGFNSSGPGYDLTGNQTFGFDFNPKTLQGDNSMRIRLVSTSNANLRLNSSTGQIATIDTNLAFANGNSPFVDGSAYINNIPQTPQAGGTTSLYNLDVRNNSLLLQNPPNAGTVSIVGPFGVTINNTERNTHFDIFTPLDNNDPTIGGDFAYAVLKRPDAPINGPFGSYLLYNVDLSSGQILNGALVGPAATPFDFVGGFAVSPIPEPGSMVFIGMTAVTLVGWQMRRRQVKVDQQ
ncbi:DUF4394 domain-containing protein [bacterium]|nr:DUF4394 domain-containing protein [bacterium]